ARVTNQPEKGYQYLTGGRSGQPVIQSADKPLAQLLRTLIVFLLGTKNTVTGIAQAGNNITVRIKVAIDGRGKYLDIGMCRLDRVDAFGRRHQNQGANGATTRFLEHVDGGNHGPACRSEEHTS